MFDYEFWNISGIIFWGLVLLYIGIRTIIGKNWPFKLGARFFLGAGLQLAARKMVSEVKKGVLKDETIIDVAVQIFWRLTRIGIFGLLIAAIPTIILFKQNKLLSDQNVKIDTQNALIEGQRRSSLVLLLDNVLADLSKEIDYQKQGLHNDSLRVLDSIGFSLSTPLIGRITSLSQGLQPYQMMIRGELTKGEYSPERAQLLLAIIGSNIDVESLTAILKSTTFQGAFLRNAYLDDAYLYNSKLVGADFSESSLLRAHLVKADLSYSNLSSAELRGAELYNAILIGACLVNADMRNAGLLNVDLKQANLTGADLSSARFRDADLLNVNFDQAILHNADFRSVNFEGAKNLTVNQLFATRSIFMSTGLPKEIIEKLSQSKPCLFTEEGCD